MPDLRISVRLSAFNLPFKKALLAASQAGAQGIEIDARNELQPTDLTDTAKRQIRKMLDDLNLRVSSLRFPTRRGYEVMADLDRRIDATKKVMRMAYDLGAGHVVNQIGRVPSDTESASWVQLRSSLEDLANFGNRVGTFLAAETGSESGEDLAALLSSLSDVYMPVAYNPGQLILNQFDPHAALNALTQYVGIVESQDGVQDLARGRGIEVPLGQGTADFPQILGQLEDAQYRGWFVVGRTGCGQAEVANAISYLTAL